MENCKTNCGLKCNPYEHYGDYVKVLPKISEWIQKSNPKKTEIQLAFELLYLLHLPS